ncbi:MAG: GntR family transcriptional regulator [Rectinemataceae bacterium]
MRFNNDRPIFAQIADQLTADVLAGLLKPGDRLPSARDLGTIFEVNPNTAARALQMLADSGLASLTRGTGYTVAADGLASARRERKERFRKDRLPGFFTEMSMLGIDMSEILQLYGEWKAAVAATAVPGGAASA